jgi:DNA-binding response OmpR family regulator
MAKSRSSIDARMGRQDLQRRSRPLRVLVADNDGTTFMVDALQSNLGVVAISAEDGTKALAAAMAEPFDLWVLNYYMPGLNGIQVLTKLRELGLGTPVIIETAWTREAVPEPTGHLMIDAWLVKPFMPTQLIETARSVIAANADALRH